MADYEKSVEGEETSSRGVDWEVVSLTASTYAAAPETEGTSVISSIKDRSWEENKSEYAREMFMSGHFVFPPSAHENLPLEPDYGEILAQSKLEDAPVNEGLSQNDNQSDENDNISISSASGKEEEASMVMGSKFEEEDEHGSIQIEEEEEEEDPLDEESSSLKPVNPSELRRSKIPCESWWRRRAVSLYVHAKEAGAVWSLCAAAALMGLVILGHRWHRERCKIQYINARFGIGEENGSRLLNPVNRFKYAVAGGAHRRYLGASSPSL